MADWYLSTALALKELAKTDPKLATLIYATVRRIEKNPTMGEYLQETRRLYVNNEDGFRISYNYHPKAKEIVIVTIHIIEKVQ